MLYLSTLGETNVFSWTLHAKPNRWQWEVFSTQAICSRLGAPDFTKHACTLPASLIKHGVLPLALLPKNNLSRKPHLRPRKSERGGHSPQGRLRPTSKRSWYIQVPAFLFSGGTMPRRLQNFPVGLSSSCPQCKQARHHIFHWSHFLYVLIVLSGIASQGNFLHMVLPCLSLLSGNPVVTWMDALTSWFHTCCSLSSTLHLILTCSSRLCLKIISSGSLLWPFLSNERSCCSVSPVMTLNILVNC